MNLILDRSKKCQDGIFSTLHDATTTELIAVTVEHAYLIGEAWQPKIPAGSFRCVRGMHQLKHGGPFETFEVMNVPGHDGILFHIGNFNDDSEGCICLGERFAGQMITDSRSAFVRFMAFQEGVNEFILVVAN